MKTETVDELRQQLDVMTKRARSAELQLLGAAHGLPPRWSSRPIGDTVEELEADARELAREYHALRSAADEDDE